MQDTNALIWHQSKIGVASEVGSWLLGISEEPRPGATVVLTELERAVGSELSISRVRKEDVALLGLRIDRMEQQASLATTGLDKL